MRKRTKEEATESGMREVEGGKQRVAVVCKRACCGPSCSLSGQVFEEDVVGVSGDESEGES